MAGGTTDVHTSRFVAVRRSLTRRPGVLDCIIVGVRTDSSAIRGRPPLDEKAHRRGCPSASESMSGVGDSRVGGGVPSTAGKGYGRLQGARKNPRDAMLVG
ncbi:PREDICTED: uncharacterized protein LOC108756957 [Trachymyrmex septentrionalis]|uniref:uncharacterized protein LOC108756957 n=1 Tax=Trachymyrmex septentrionalis TaxID=34720 RepID=UPI00084F56B6|nr:PREDICTED: uncharacterized protein LOC108756957 [Trachymyrmex septentrionalis]